MKVFLKHRKTGEFFKGPEQWTKNFEEAFLFPDSAKAVEFYMRHYLPEVEVVVHDGHPRAATFHLNEDQAPQTREDRSAGQAEKS